MKYIGLVILVLLFPQVIHAAVRITEVAWMGTTSSQYSEWIELYNDSESDVDLAGWKLYEGDGGALVFTFSKRIGSQEYLLLERTTASAPDAVSGINDEAGAFGGGGFANTGEDLVLKDSNGITVDELNFIDGWPAGDATTKATMQLDGDEWITAKPSPKAGSGGESSNGSSDTEVVQDSSDPFPIPPVSPNKPMVEFTVPSVVYRGTSYEFSAQPVLEYNFRVRNGSVYWNMGDGTIVRQEKAAPIFHTYQYPGTYTMYYSYTDTFTKNAPLIGTKKIKVVEPTLTLSMVGTSAIELNNTANTSIDLSGWKVMSGNIAVPIPDKTIIAEKSKVTIPLSVFGMSSASSVRILDPSGSLITQTGGQQKATLPSISSEVYESPEDEIQPQDLMSQTIGIETEQSSTPIRNRTKTIIFGAVALFVIGLSILLERAMARREYQEES